VILGALALTFAVAAEQRLPLSRAPNEKQIARCEKQAFAAPIHCDQEIKGPASRWNRVFEPRSGAIYVAQGVSPGESSSRDIEPRSGGICPCEGGEEVAPQSSEIRDAAAPRLTLTINRLPRAHALGYLDLAAPRLSAPPQQRVVSVAHETSSPKHINRLAHETSRYLLQHATNPVDWYPWSKAALKAARAQNKLIFLSIGYSTCHWCHVMEAESFSNDAIGAAMNENFVAIKVDREERPDIDSAYMAVARKMMSDPGWPLNVILTPDGKPFFAASYIPRDRLQALLERLGTAWKEHPEQIASTAAMVTQSLSPEPVAGDGAPNAAMLTVAYQQLAARFDAVNGGFLPPPKVPAAHQLMFLLRYWRRSGDGHALEMVETTLHAIRNGAIWDQSRFGFHRYTVDAAWREPHYEKMLCDQALLAMVYLEAYQVTHKPEYSRTARDIFTYVLRDLRAPNGAFYSASDSDERGVRDEKILTDWNGLMIAALASGAAVLNDETYATAARRDADLVLAGGTLQHQRGRDAYLDDYTFAVWGLLNLYETTFEARDLHRAIALERESLKRFRDSTGRFFMTANDAEPLLVRPRETSDGSLPSGNSVQLMNLVRIARITGDPFYEKAANDLLRASAGDVSDVPSASAHLMSALDFLIGPSFEIVLAGDDVHPLQRAVFAPFVPNKIVLRSEPDIARIAPFTKLQKAIRGKAAAYVCTNQQCKLPTGDPAKVTALLEARAK
jgi:uncharacterized protein YyaL (SSP411 family)